MLTTIKTIEDLSINAWPSHQVQYYDGWILRYSAFYTHRTNCVEQLGPSIIPLEQKVRFCEDVYRRWQTPCIFKISPRSDPLLDRILDIEGYEIQHHTTVMTYDLQFYENSVGASNIAVNIEPRVTPIWIQSLFRLKNTTNPIHRRIVPSMYDAIPMNEIAVSVTDGTEIIATGLGILDRSYVGIYAIHVAEEYRHQGIAAAMIHTILTEAIRRGADHAYLQVVSNNTPAKTLYRKLGFQEMYRYYFRVK